MAENVRHWKSTTTGRKNIPIVAEKPVKKKRDEKGRYIKTEE
tara:strand:- start:668 stop:793 length:126 start_codon:yes stop_codon:yes gene_type:complete